jgi:hypothetical protein
MVVPGLVVAFNNGIDPLSNFLDIVPTFFFGVDCSFVPYAQLPISDVLERVIRLRQAVRIV